MFLCVVIKSAGEILVCAKSTRSTFICPNMNDGNKEDGMCSFEHMLCAFLIAHMYTHIKAYTRSHILTYYSSSAHGLMRIRSVPFYVVFTYKFIEKSTTKF